MHTQHMPHIMIVNRLEANKERFRPEGLNQLRPHSSRSLQFDRKVRPLSFRIKDVSAKEVSGKKCSGRFVKNMLKSLRLKRFAKTFRMICGAYPVYARSPSPSQRPAPTTIDRFAISVPARSLLLFDLA